MYNLYYLLGIKETEQRMPGFCMRPEEQAAGQSRAANERLPAGGTGESLGLGANSVGSTLGLASKPLHLGSSTVQGIKCL